MGYTIEAEKIGGTAEVANLLSCPKQQIHALRKRADFPKPFMTISASPLWNLDEITTWAQTWKRRKQA